MPWARPLLTRATSGFAVGFGFINGESVHGRPTLAAKTTGKSNVNRSCGKNTARWCCEGTVNTSYYRSGRASNGTDDSCDTPSIEVSELGAISATTLYFTFRAFRGLIAKMLPHDSYRWGSTIVNPTASQPKTSSSENECDAHCLSSPLVSLHPVGFTNRPMPHSQLQRPANGRHPSSPRPM